MKNTLILITNIPTPYRLTLWDVIKKLTDFNVICIVNNEKNRQWNTESRPYINFLMSYHLFFQKKDWALHFSFPFSLFFLLVKHHPDAVLITGYDSIQYWEALLYAKLFRKKKVLWNGSTLFSSRSQNKIVYVLKDYFVNSFDSYYTYGSQATKYLVSFGICPDKIVTGTNTVDTDFYKNNTSDETIHSDILKFLYVGQLIKRKGLNSAIESFSKISNNNWKLTIVGSGADENLLKELVTQYHLKDKIKFAGYKQKDEIIDYYSDADVFLMPSYLEVWGLVLNEALASGLFCLSSKYAGATFDLIQEGKNGYIVDPKDVSDLAGKIDKTFDIKLDKRAIKDSFQISNEEEAIKIILAVEKAVK
jgi:glycosyltransferase involved in cell wall biosynthesis